MLTLSWTFYSLLCTISSCCQTWRAWEWQQGCCWISCSPRPFPAPLPHPLSQGSRAGPGCVPWWAALAWVQPQQKTSTSSQAFSSPGFWPWGSVTSFFLNGPSPVLGSAWALFKGTKGFLGTTTRLTSNPALKCHLLGWVNWGIHNLYGIQWPQWGTPTPLLNLQKHHHPSNTSHECGSGLETPQSYSKSWLILYVVVVGYFTDPSPGASLYQLTKDSDCFLLSFLQAAGKATVKRMFLQ